MSVERYRQNLDIDRIVEFVHNFLVAAFELVLVLELAFELVLAFVSIAYLSLLIKMNLNNQNYYQVLEVILEELKGIFFDCLEQKLA